MPSPSQSQARFLRRYQQLASGQWVSRKSPLPSPKSRSRSPKRASPKRSLSHKTASFNRKYEYVGGKYRPRATPLPSPPRASKKSHSKLTSFFSKMTLKSSARRKSPKLTAAQRAYLEANPYEGYNVFQMANMKR